jgi:DNA-binding MarR family transcriptional regulator
MHRSTTGDATDPVLETMNALRQIVRALRVSSREVERTLGLSSAQLFVLQQLKKSPAASIKTLARRTMTDPSSVSVVVQRLAERGLVSRRTSPDDARKTELRLSRSGGALLRAAPTTAQESLLSALLELPPAEQAALSKLLGKVVGAMGAGGHAAAMFFEDELRRTPRGRRTRSDAR